MELRAGDLLVERTPSALDEAVLSFTELHDDCEIEYFTVSDYVANSPDGSARWRPSTSSSNTSAQPWSTD